MARARTTKFAAVTAIVLAILPGPVAYAARVVDSDGPQWPNAPLPALQSDAPGRGAKADSFEARWPSISDDIVGSIPSPSVPRTPWLGEERAASNPFVRSGPSAFDGDLGLRYWFNWAKTGKDLYDIPGDALVSRLTYDGMYGNSGEGFGRLDHTSGFYTKGYLGGGLFAKGQLKDEDFPPTTTPYSSTLSSLSGSSLGYANVDLGFNFWRDQTFRIGGFTGYHYFNQRVHAYGCNQIAGNTSICGTTPVSDSIQVIEQDNSWHSLRVGVDADLKIGDKITLRADAAYLPYVKMYGMDLHHLRIGTTVGDFAGGIPEDGAGRGYQFEASIAYAVDENVSLAVGGRYWHMEASGQTHFEGNVVGTTTSPQPVNWSTDIYGVFVQGSFKFGPYPTSSF